MLHAFTKRLLSEVKGDYGTNLPPGTLTWSELYQERQFGEIDGIGTVEIDATGNMVGFSPVERCKDRSGETDWVPLRLIRNLRPSFFGTGTERASTIGRPKGSKTAAE